LQIGSKAVHVFHTQISSPEPDVGVLELTGLVFDWFAKLCGKFARWLAAKGDEFVSEFVKSMAKTLGIATAAALVGLAITGQ
jgi:hypothetical protein